MDADNPKYTTDDGTLYSKDHSMLYAYPNGRESKTFAMHPQTERTDDFVFWFCKNLEEVEFSPSFKSFGYRAFCGCSNLKKITVKTNEPVENEYTDDVFEEVNRDVCQLVVPEGYRQVYLQSPTWGGFNIVESTTSGMGKNGNENMTVKDSGAGIVIDNIGADVHTVTLSNLSGQTLSRASVGHGCAVLPAEALPAGRICRHASRRGWKPYVEINSALSVFRRSSCMLVRLTRIGHPTAEFIQMDSGDRFGINGHFLIYFMAFHSCQWSRYTVVRWQCLDGCLRLAV